MLDIKGSPEIQVQVQRWLFTGHVLHNDKLIIHGNLFSIFTHNYVIKICCFCAFNYIRLEITSMHEISCIPCTC